MPDGNPLVASAQNQTTAVTGIGIAESAQGLAEGVSNGDWVEAGLSAVGVGLEVLSMVIDPLGTLASYGVSWLIEHVRPLKEALDWFAGDPPVIQSFADTWSNVAGEVNTIAADFQRQSGAGTSGWTGAAADQYRGHSTEAADALAGAATLADGISTGVMIMGQVVAFVREFIRDLVGELVGKLISWALEEAATLGLATPVVVAQATAAISKVVNKVSDVIRKLVKTIGNVSPRIRKIIDKLDEIVKKLAKLMRKSDGGGTTPSAARSAGKHADDTPTVHGPDGSTTPSSAHTPDGSTTPSSTRTPDGTTSPSSTPDTPGTRTDTGATPDAGTPSPTSKPDGTTSPSGTKPARIKDDMGAPRDNAVPAGKLRCEKDPVDVASGRMVMSQVDAEFLGVLPLVLRRIHLSSYRSGRHFGSSWISTVDQRLEVESDAVYLAADDGTLQAFPHPGLGTTSLAEEGPRRVLERTEDGGYRLTDHEQRRVLHFDGTGPTRPLRTISDGNGNRIDFQYDGSGAATGISHSSGYRVRVDSEGGLVTALHLCGDGGEPDVTLMRYRYENGRLAEVVNASGLPVRFDYDAEGRVTGWTDRNGAWYRYVYDAAGRVVRTEGPHGAFSGTMEYDEDNRVTHSIDSLGNRTSFQLNDARQVVGEVNPLGAETRYEWDRYDRLLSRTDPLGRTERFEYDENGNLVTHTRADGTRYLFTYDERSLPVAEVHPDGAVYRWEHDERGNMTRFVDAEGNVTSFAYDERGGAVSVTDPAGHVRRIVNDDFGLPASVTDPLGAVTRFRRDRFGRLVSVTDPVGGTTRFGWTVGGGLAWRALPDGSVERWTYDGEDNARVHTDPMGQVTRTDYGPFDLPVAERRPDGTSLRFAYDTETRLTAVTNELGQTWRREYDAAGNLVREVDFSGRSIAYRYDVAGQLVERTNGAGEVTTFGYDAVGDMVERRAGDGVTTFVHDAVGRLTRATNATSELTFQRDRAGRVVAETCDGRTVLSTYDALGRKVRRRTPGGIESVWEYDANDQPTALRTAGHVLRFSHDLAGQELQRYIGDDVVLTQRWSPNRQLVSQAITAPSGRLQQRGYGYRADGHLTSVEDQLTGRRTFDLDLAGRVTAVGGGDWSERYRYDPAGTVTDAFWQRAGAEPAARGRTRYERDAQGRVVLRQRKRLSRKPETWRYSWNADDRLVGVRTPDGTTWRYSYDALGRRIAKERLGADGVSVVERIDFVWDGVVLVEQTHSTPDSAAVRVTAWEYEPDRFTPVAQSQVSWLRNAPREWVDEQFYAIVADVNGTPAEMVSERGELVWSHRTTVWGETIAQRGTDGAYTPLRFPGQYADPESGLNYNYFRHYDPDTGEYASADPLGLAAGTKPHSYVSNPLDLVDPLGLVSCTLRDYADSLRGANQASTPRVASQYTTPSGRVYHGHNREGVPLPDHLRNEMQQIAPLSNRHGACGEVNALSRAYHGERAAAIAAGHSPAQADRIAEQAIRGGSMESVRVRPQGSPVNPDGTPVSHGTPIDPCPPYCTPLLRRLGISW